MIFNFFLDHQKDHNLPHWYINLIAKKSSQFLVYSHIQVLVSAVHKLKQKWSVELFSAFARLKKWPSIKEHVLILDNRL